MEVPEESVPNGGDEEVVRNEEGDNSTKVENEEATLTRSDTQRQHLEDPIDYYTRNRDPRFYKPFLSASLPSIFPREGDFAAIETGLLFKDPHQIVTVEVSISPKPTDHLVPFFASPEPIGIPLTFLSALPEREHIPNRIHLSLDSLSRSLQAFSNTSTDHTMTIARGYYRNPVGICAMLEIFGREYIANAAIRLHGIQDFVDDQAGRYVEAAWGLLGFRWPFDVQLNQLRQVGKHAADMTDLAGTVVKNMDRFEYLLWQLKGSFEDVVVSSVVYKVDVLRIWASGLKRDLEQAESDIRVLMQRVNADRSAQHQPYYPGVNLPERGKLTGGCGEVCWVVANLGVDSD